MSILGVGGVGAAGASGTGGPLASRDALSAVPVAAPNSCAAVRAQLAADAARGVDRVSCVTAAVSAATAAAASLCRSNAEVFNRFEDCFNDGWTLSIIDTSNGEVVGTVTGATIFWNTLSYKSRTWTEHIKVKITDVTAEGAGTTFTAPLECNTTTAGECATTGTGSWAGQSGELDATDGAVYTGELG